MTAKLNLIGRQGRAIRAGGCVITTTQSVGKLPLLTKGLPAPVAQPTTFVVYVTAKRRRKIEAALVDPDDASIVEGLAVYNERYPARRCWRRAGRQRHGR